MTFFDSLLTIGRTNRGEVETPLDQAQALTLMDRYDVSDALVVHTVGRDADAELGNQALDAIDSKRLGKVWCIEPACVVEEKPDAFVERALGHNAKAFLINPCTRDIRIDRCVRLLQIAEILEQRRIPLFAAYRQYDVGQDSIDWYALSDFCRKFPNLPVISWEWRSRANRPMFDALTEAKNLRVSLASIWQAQMLEQICNSFGAYRLLFSLGMPSLDPAMFQAVVTYANVDDAMKRAVASDNIRIILSEADYD